MPRNPLSTASPSQPPSPESLFPGCLVVAGDLASPLPLEHTAVQVEITGPLAEVSVTQSFSNPLRENAELIYLFPLSHTAALTGFELRLGKRTIRGELQELEAARKEYEEAVRQGHQAGLAEQRMPGLYSVSLANVQPGESVHAIFRYHERLKYDDNAYEFVFPMGLTPKYHSPVHPEEGDGVDAPLASPGERIGDVSLEVNLQPGLPYGDPVSPSHNLAVEENRSGGLRIYLATPALPDHDFVLRLPVQVSGNTLAAWRTPNPDGDYFLALLLPPPLSGEQADPLPRQFIFVLDRSGSMGGQPIAQARNALRACLRTLNPQDEFAIQLFDHEVEWYRSEFRPVTQVEIDSADQFLTEVEGRGGTEIVAALHAALTFGLPASEKLRYVVFLTDGAVSANERALQEITRLLGQARLFTFGIGPSVNRPLLSRIASLGRGTSEFLQLNEDIEGAIIRFQDRLAFPALTDLQLSAENAKLWDVYPSPLPDAYIGQPVVVTGRIKASGKHAQRLVVKGRLAGEGVEIPFGLPLAVENPAVRHTWAQARLDALMETSQQEGANASKLRSEVIHLALDYTLISPYTAFIAIDRDSRVLGGSRRVRISQPLPEGLDINGFTGGGTMKRMMRMPTAMAAPDMSLSPTNTPASFSMDAAMPAFMRRGMAKNIPEPAETQPATPQDHLRRLARSQKLDGSWDADVEYTAAALLFFLRQGHSATRGSFRVAIQRAAAWLRQHPAAGLAELTRILALVELERASGQIAEPAAALAWAQAELNPALSAAESGWLARLLAGEALLEGEKITSADELRLAALGGQKLPLAADPGQWLPPERAALWQALIA